MVLDQPLRVVQGPHRPMSRCLEVFEAASVPTVGRGALGRQGVLFEAQKGVEVGLEVGLADQGGPVAGQPKDLHDRGCVTGQRDAVHEHPVGSRVLAGHDGGARRHAHHGLRVGPLVADSVGGQPVDHGGAGQDAAVAGQRVEALLVGGHEEDLAAHQRAPFGCPRSGEKGETGGRAGASRCRGLMGSPSRRGTPVGG